MEIPSLVVLDVVGGIVVVDVVDVVEVDVVSNIGRT